MKNFFIGVTLITSLGAYSMAPDAADTKMFSKIEQEVTKQLDSKKRPGIFKQIKLARKGYKEWKKENPNHREIRRELRRIKRRMKKQGTMENNTLRSAVEKCNTDKENCLRILETNINSIYMGSNIASLAPKKSFSIISKAYASSGLEMQSCGNDIGQFGTHDSTDTEFHALLFGNIGCGMKLIGPGAYISMAGSYNVRMCIGTPSGTNVGLFGHGSALLGLGFGITVGGGGVCQILSLKYGGVGAGAGVIVFDAYDSRSMWN